MSKAQLLLSLPILKSDELWRENTIKWYSRGFSKAKKFEALTE